MYNLYIMHAQQTNHLSRTQIYLTAEQQLALGVLSKRQSQSKSELIRGAIDQMIAAQQEKNQQASTKQQRMAALAGAWNENSFTTDIRAMRDEWASRSPANT
jgi:metal-responsive CopG/Arc/MetJ family transcriptional regulator